MEVTEETSEMMEVSVWMSMEVTTTTDAMLSSGTATTEPIKDGLLLRLLTSELLFNGRNHQFQMADSSNSELN
jgi:hypothetical protein